MVVAGVAVAPSVQVAALNQAGDTVTAFGGPVTLSIAAGSGVAGATLFGTTTVAAVNGIATFTGLSIDNAGKELKANMTANAEIVLEELPNSLLLAEGAVVYDGQRRTFVDIVDAAERTGRRRIPVKVGVGNGTRIQILEGLKEGDKVVLPG